MHVVQLLKNNKLPLILASIWAMGLFILGFFVTQSSFKFIMVGYLLAFVTYACILWLLYRKKYDSSIHWKFYLGIGFVIRIILLFAFPALSDDIYRFIWDGRLIVQGVHPLAYLPTQIIEGSFSINGLTPSLFAELNSPNYYTIYPPFAQLVFALSSWIWPGTVFSSMFYMKVFLIVGEGLGIYYLIRLLAHLKLPRYLALFYWLNPLVIAEIMGNMHFEGWMITWLMMSLYLLLNKRFVGSGISMGLAIGTKLLPLMFVPLWLLYIGKVKHASVWLLGLTACLVLQFVPYFYTLDLANFLSSFQLYFQKFEFNAGIYYAFRAIGRLIVGYNPIQYIGPAMGILALLIILFRSWTIHKVRTPMKLLHHMFYIYLTYVLLATTVHPWYIILLVALGAFSMRGSVLLWSFLITFTYINYAYEPYAENLWVVAFEYIMFLAALLYEVIFYRNRFSNPRVEL